ncbi:MAG: beta-galactosidase trimerization domain-containing protein [Verrucomicrobiota bacterium]
MSKPLLSRREFLRASGVVVTAATMASFCPAGQAGPIDTAATPSWVNRPMRWGQLTLVEDDPGKYDPHFWIDYFRRTRCDAVCLSAGGCVAYYPTRIPLHYRSKWLGKTDSFGDLVKGCREHGMIVIARTDPHATYQETCDAHPDWIAVDASGNRRRHWASPEMWVTCALGPYNFDFMTEVKKEIMSLYRVDGIFINRWDGSGMCYCEHCQRHFREAAGQDLPRTNNPQDPARRAYILWRQQRLFELWRLWDGAVRAINPDSCVIPNTGGGATSSLDMRQIGELAPTLFADRQARRGVTVPWANGKNAKEYRATMGAKPIVGIFSVGLEEPYRWKDSVQSGAEIRIWALDGMANGLRPWFTKFSGVLHDQRWLPAVEALYRWHARAERYLRCEQPLARVAMVYSQQTAWFYGSERAGPKVEDHTLGLYHALIEARIPFEMVHDRSLDPPHVDRFKLLILPNIAALSDAQCAQLKSYVARGGSLVATHETSLYDEWGTRRSDFGLADLFGVSFGGRMEGPMQNSYLRLEPDPLTGNLSPLLEGLEDAPRIVNGVWRVDVTPQQPFPHPPLTLIPSYPDLPMEKVYPRQPQTETAGVYLREMPSGGRLVYFPWDIDRTFWEVLCPDHGRLLRNAVRWAMNEEPPVTVTGPGILDVTAWRQPNALTVHLVNLTNPMMMKGPFREFLPVGAQQVRLQVPDGVKPGRTQLLVSGKKVRPRRAGKFLFITVPGIVDHELIAVDLAG